MCNKFVFGLFFLVLSSFYGGVFAAQDQAKSDAVSPAKPGATEVKSPAAPPEDVKLVNRIEKKQVEQGGAGDFLIGSLDLIEVKVLYADEISRTVRVDSQGNISLPLVGIIKAAGLSSHQLEQLIKEKLAKDLIKDPQVSVFIKEFTSLRMTVQGAVIKAGLYDFQGRATLMQAISMAGGLTEKANENKVKVIRRLAAQGADTLEFDLSKIRMNEINDPVLQNGDVVVVEQSNPIGIQGMVHRSGNYYPNGGKMTLSQIISQAEGLTDFADPTDIRVLSTTEGGRQVSVAYNFASIRDGKLPDPELHPGDLVVVETSGFKSVIYGITNIFRGFVTPIGPR